MTRHGWKAAALALLAVTLSACGGSGQDAGRTTLKVWAMGEEGKLLEEFAASFEQEHSDIQVDVQAIPWANAHDKLLTAVASGKGPDVLQIGTTWVAEFGEAETFLDLTDYMEEYPNFARDNFFEGATSSTEFDGKIIGIPWYVDTRVLFYRTDLLADVGYPEGPQTWEEVEDAAGQLAARGGRSYGLDIDQQDQNFPFMLAWEQGWQYEIEAGAESFAEPGFVRAMDIYTGFFARGEAPVSDDMDITQAFRQGIKPMFFSGPWMVRTIQDQAPELEGQWNVTLMPEGETRDSLIGGAHMTVFHNSPHVEEALAFISYLADPQTQTEWYDVSKALPAVKSAWDTPALAEDEMLGVFQEQMQHVKAPPLIGQYERIATELRKAIERINVGGTPLDEALERFRDEADSILSR
ncbi:sugar ABC transporter substrate-binding protein [Paenibacillus sp. IB182496]|uniref:Sugar ABC transporter substrate-binding protein n=1 Tax=Paenibacillus sabuli TaxID=2772509 RepID=A0A927BX99_9BACL|nr:sugar ABC transporter substrate-binding protein [Paenibacillus sabuli]MBD2848576.1 sugar ABC transporter substrate-binding protein [Paenibacillus sabuli]